MTSQIALTPTIVLPTNPVDDVRAGDTDLSLEAVSTHPNDSPNDHVSPSVDDHGASAAVHAAKQGLESQDFTINEHFASSTLTTQKHTYTTVSALGAGGMGTVYLATDENGNPVAIKTPKIDRSKPVQPQVTRLKREIENMRLMTGVKGIIPLLDSKFDPKNPDDTVIVMPVYSEGSLLSKITSDDKPSLMSIVYMAKKAASALGELHSRGIVHRDIKLANILLEKAVKPESQYDKYDVVVCDYGLSKDMSDPENPVMKTVATQTGQIVGTLDSMSPEQSRSEKHLSESTDIFSLATVLYTALTGRSVFKSTQTIKILMTLQKVEDAVKNGEYTPAKDANPAIPEDLANLIDDILTTSDADERLAKAGLSGSGSNAATALAYKLQEMLTGYIDADCIIDLNNLANNVTPTPKDSKSKAAA